MNIFIAAFALDGLAFAALAEVPLNVLHQAVPADNTAIVLGVRESGADCANIK